MNLLRCLPPVLLLILGACATEKPAPPPETKEAETKEPEKKEAEPPSPVAGISRVKFETSKGDFVVEVHNDWAPLGARRFHDLVSDNFFDGARFFRVLPNFVVQFGLAADPAKSRKWDNPIKDDPVLRTNGLGTVSFATAGPNTRTSQIFINLRSNQMLDDQGFAPFGRVTEGFEIVQRLYQGYGEEPDQDQITRLGNAYLTAQFPNLDYIKKATLLP